MLKNIIIVSDYGYIEGGAGRIAHETALSLKQEGYRVCFFCAVGPVSEHLTGAGIEVTCLNQTDILHAKSKLKGVFQGIYNKQAKKAFATLLDGFFPEDTVIHVHTWTKALSSSVFAVAKKKKFKVLLTVHDYFLVCPNGGLFIYPKREICEIKPMSFSCIKCNCDARSYPQKLFRVLRQHKQNRVLKKCDNISYAFISEFSKREFFKRHKAIPENRQYFLPNMINFDSARTRVACEDNDVFLFVGSLSEVKGIRNFCEAVTKAGVKGIAIGQGPLQEELETAYPNVSFVGWKNKEEMLPYLQQTRCLIFPSIIYETLGLTPLEMMAYGIPVLVSSLCAATDYVDKEWHYEGKNVDALVEKIRWVQNLPLRETSERIFNGFDTEYYSAKTYRNNLTEIFNDMLRH